MNLPFSTAFATAWQEWLTYRKERRLPAYKPTGLKKTISHLIIISNNDEQTAIQILDQSIAQNYQGLFPLKNNYVNRNNISQSEQLNNTLASIKESIRNNY
jgi:hypothetical protein